MNLMITTDIQQMVLGTATTQSTPSASTTIITTQTTQASNGQKVLSSDQAYVDVTYAVQKGVYAGLDTILAQMVKNSVNMALEDVNFNNRSDIEAETVSKHFLETNERLAATGDCGDSFLYGRSTPRVVEQTTTKSTINAWLATIIIRSTTTILQQRFCENTSDSEEPLMTSKTTHKIDGCPNYLIQARYLVFIDQRRRGSVFGCSDMRLRCYNNVPFNALIAKACRMGDLFMVRRLFAEGKATIHDMTLSSERGIISPLLFHVWEECFYTISIVNKDTCGCRISKTVVRLSKLFRVMEYLIEAGIDPSDSTPNHSTGTTPLFWRVIHKLFGYHPLTIHGPLEKDGILEPRLEDGLRYSIVAQFIPCVQTQET